ncbi:MAG TPA: UvrD-helicase domain-containing protein [Anaerolineales bacterium]|nr:UvrD-helicase domain-containing protein [Anaerolineales bacterium]
MMNLTGTQLQIIESPLDMKIFVSGPFGTGKTSAGVERMRFLLSQGVPADSILMLAPQRTMQEPFLDLLYSPERAAGGEVTSATMGGLARRMVDLFWPLAAEAAGFSNPDQPPIFLSLETAQYYMAHIVRPLLDQGYFESVTMDRNRLYSQILDNLNKAAVTGFSYTQIAERLDAAYYGDPAQRRVYADAQDCATRFREYCLQHNLLDFSLVMEVFAEILWNTPQVRDYLTRTYRHLIYDNVEEDNARSHDMIRDWLPDFDSALLLFDPSGGFRYFLGADIRTGGSLVQLCVAQIDMQESFVSTASVTYLREGLIEAIAPTFESKVQSDITDGSPLSFVQSRFYPELLDLAVSEIQKLVTEGTPPSEIVILAPYLSDALRFSITHRLETGGIPWRTHRPSRSLRDEPASHALITFAALGHPHWNVHPPKFDVAYALMQSIDGLDLVRAQLLTDIVYRQKDVSLSPFDIIQPDVQERITFLLGNRYTILRDWLLEYREGLPLPLDHFFRKLFGEILSQAGFGYHRSFDSVRVAGNLVESVKNFRMAMEPSIVGKDSPSFDLGREYIAMLDEGVIAASYFEAWRSENKDAVLVSPAHTFLMMNRPVTYQFWLDPGSSGWYERLVQPLTHPYVLSRGWEPGRMWSDADEVQVSTEAMARLVSGLLLRCRERVYVGISELGESGFEQRGELLRAFQKVLASSS